MEPLRTIDQAAEWLGIPAHTLRKLVSARSVPHTRIGRHVRFSADHLAAIVAAGEELPATAPTRDQVTQIRAAAPRRRQRSPIAA